MFKTVATLRFAIVLLACIRAGSAFATDITFQMSGSSPYCGGTVATVSYDASGNTFDPGNSFHVELSNAAGSFSSPQVIGTLSSTSVTGDITITFPASASSSNYSIRVVSTSPAVVGTGGSTFTINPVVTPAITIASDPSTTVGAGSVVYFSSTVTEGGSSPSFEWKRNGQIIGTSSSNAIVVPDAAAGDQIVASVTSSSPCGVQTTSNTVNIPVDSKLTKTNHAWDVRAALPDRSNAAGFSIGTKAYIGTGSSSAAAYLKDFWEYDPISNVWTQKADFTGLARYNAVGFSVSTKGYIGTGISAIGARKDIYQYDPTSNTWLQRNDIPGVAREQAFSFVIGNRAYIGGGYITGTGDLKDFYEFDPSGNSWTPKADFAGGKRMGNAAFAIDTKGYLAGGYSSSSNTWFKDLWEYDQAQNLWTQRADIPGNPRTRATGFALAGNGYVGLGYSMNRYEGQFFQYTPSTNQWSWKPYYPGPATQTLGTGIVVGNRAFVYKDGTWIEYNPFTTMSFSAALCSTETFSVNFDGSAFVFAPGNIFKAQISPTQNFSVSSNVGSLTSNAGTGTIEAEVPVNANGNYYFRIISSNPQLTTTIETLTITGLPGNHSISAEGGATVCKDVAVTFKSNLTGPGFQWYKNNIAVGTDDSQYMESSFATGDIVKCVRTYTDGCSEPVGVVSNIINIKVNEAIKPKVSISGPNTLKSTNAVTYQWYLGESPISGANSQTYTMTNSGTYKVRITDNSGCMAFSDAVVDLYVGLEDDVVTWNISTYPNPVLSEITLNVNEDLIIKGCTFSVLNELGEVVVGNQKAAVTNKINLAGRSPGLYMVRLNVEGTTVTRRIMKIE